MKFSKLKLLSFMLLISLSVGFKFKNFIRNGCPAYACNRFCLPNQVATPTPGDNGFKFEVDDQVLIDNKYVPEKTYKCK